MPSPSLGRKVLIQMSACWFLVFLLGSAAVSTSAQSECTVSDVEFRQLNARVLRFKSNHCDGMLLGKCLSDNEFVMQIGYSDICSYDDWDIYYRDFEEDGCTAKEVSGVKNEMLDINLDWRGRCGTGGPSTLRLIIAELDFCDDDKEMDEEVPIPR
jgi:hypothetical protein